MVVRHGNVGGVAHGLLNGSDMVGYEFSSLVADLESLIVVLGAFPRFPVIACRRRHRAPLASEDGSYAQIILEHRKPRGDSLLIIGGDVFDVVRARVTLGVHADLVAKFPAKHLIDRHAISFAGQIPQRVLNRVDAAPPTVIRAMDLDLAEDLVNVAGILAEHSGLMRQHVVRLGAVPNRLAVTRNSLIGIDSDDDRAARCPSRAGSRRRQRSPAAASARPTPARLASRPSQNGDAHVSDFQVRRN